MRRRRQEWVERVDQWRRSGLTAKRFAASIGVKAGTLTHWAWRLGHEQQRRKVQRGSVMASAAQSDAFVEIVATATRDDRFELVVGNGRELRIPADFDATALERLLGVLEAAR